MRIARLLKEVGERAWYARDRVPVLRAGIPWRLPYGGWFAAYGDPMGARIAGYHLAGHPYEESDWKFVRRHLQPGATFVDVGANQGFFTILASRCVGRSGRVLAFEPASTEMRKLRRNLGLNSCINVSVEEMAVGAREGVADFHFYPRQGPWSSLRQAGEDVTSHSVLVKVPITTLDGYCRGHSIAEVDMVKIDVEGGELDVLRGAEELLDRFRPLVLCEVQESRTRPWGYQPEDIIREFEHHRYIVLATFGNGQVTRTGADPSAWQNLVGVPEESVERLLTVQGRSARAS